MNHQLLNAFFVFKNQYGLLEFRSELALVGYFFLFLHHFVEVI